MSNHNNNGDLILSMNHGFVPDPAVVEKIIREGLIAKYGEVYTQMILDDWAVDSCDAKNLIMHAGSAFQCEVICKRLLSDIAKIIEAVYVIQPVISVASKE